MMAGFSLSINGSTEHHRLNTHQSASLVGLVTTCCHLNQELEIKGKLRILHSMETRGRLLSELTHRMRFVYLPQPTSWLNQIECWFSIVVRRLIRRGNFVSTQDLQQQILDFMDDCNRTMAKLFQWKFKGFPECS